MTKLLYYFNFKMYVLFFNFFQKSLNSRVISRELIQAIVHVWFVGTKMISRLIINFESIKCIYIYIYI